MMLAWVVYILVVSALAGLAAAAAERAVRLYDLPARGAWAGAMVASVAFPLAAWLTGGPPGAAVALPPIGVGEVASRIGDAAAAAGSRGSLPSLSTILLGAWGVTSAAALVWFGWSVLCLHRSLEELPTRSVGDVAVHLTDEEGPACWGLPGRTARVLLPAWLREMTPDLRRLAVTHEREHLRGGDSLLVAGGCLLVAAVPWNLPLWWQLRRLRRAVELDCDARVLSAGADRYDYGRLLLAVGGRSGSSAWTALPLSEATSHLEGRIRTMISTSPSYRVVRAVAFALLALGAGALACETSPPDPGAETDAVAERAPTDPPSSTPEPEAIPYDEPPELQNPSDVQARLQEVYPDSLKQAGVGGTVTLSMYVDQEGRVVETRVKDSEGPDAFEGPAQKVVDAMEFTAARSDGQTKAVWVQQRIQFRVK